ncbi:MAG: hypothetical protein ACFFF4_02845 [Candidatus Thorarchaeota archaeon]
MRYTNSLRIFCIASIVLLLSPALLPMSCDAATVWSDDFSDGNYNDWTTDVESFSATDGYLECTEDTRPGAGSKIYHNSTVNYGTWSFNFLYVMPGGIWIFFWADDTSIQTGVVFFIEIYEELVLLYRNNQELGYWSSSAVLTEAWTQIDVTMDEAFNIEVFVNETHRIHYKTVDPASDCLLFGVGMNQDGQAIDNVVVSNSIDIVCTDSDCELDHATTTTTTPTSSTTPTATTTPTVMSLPIEMFVLVGGVVAVVIILAIYLKRR